MRTARVSTTADLVAALADADEIEIAGALSEQGRS
jgi:hypothetical protein